MVLMLKSPLFEGGMILLSWEPLPPRLDAAWPLQLTNSEAPSPISLRHRESYFPRIAILRLPRRDKETYFLEIVSEHPQSWQK